MAEKLLIALAAPAPGETAAISILWFQSIDGETWDIEPVDSVLVADLPIDEATGKLLWDSVLADPAKYHQLKTVSAGGDIAEHGLVIPPQSYQAIVRREVNNYNQPLTNGEGKVAANVRITFRPVKGGRPAQVADTDTGEMILPSPIATFTDDKGEFSIYLWPTDRGPVGTKWRCEIALPRCKPFDVSLPEGDLSAIKLSALS